MATNEEKVTLTELERHLVEIKAQLKKQDKKANMALWLWPIALGGSCTVSSFSLWPKPEGFLLSVIGVLVALGSLLQVYRYRR